MSWPVVLPRKPAASLDELLAELDRWAPPPIKRRLPGPPPNLQQAMDLERSCHGCQHFLYRHGLWVRGKGECTLYGSEVAEVWTCDDFEGS